MGIDYSSATGYGFIVDQEKAKALWPSTYDDGGMYEVMEKVCKDYPLLSFDSGHPYDATDEETDFVIVVRALHRSHGNYDSNFGAFLLGKPKLNLEELAQIEAAYKEYGTGIIGALAVFNCS